MKSNDLPLLIRGDKFSDHRGVVLYNNRLPLSDFVRTYVIQNADDNPFRGWHCHLEEAKMFLCLRGSVKIGAVSVNDPSSPDKKSEVFHQDLIAGELSMYFVPAGFANAILSLVPKSAVMVFSNRTLQESQLDDFRFPQDFWNLPS